MNNNIIRLTEDKFHQLIKEGVNKVINEMARPDGFSLRMHKLYSLLGDEVGGDSMRDTIAAYFWDHNWTGETKVVPCKYDERGMYALTYQLCNYDAICLNDNGVVDVYNSNVPEIAKLMKPLVSKEIGMRIVRNLYGRY